MNITRPTIMEIDLKALEHNIKEIKKYIGPSITIMPIIKANAYGTYINYRKDILEQFNIVGVATVDEAVDLRNNGYTKEIFVLNQPYITEIDKIIKYNITTSLSEYNFLQELIKKQTKVKVHLEIETGMNRTGININELNSFIETIKKYSNIEIEGIYTHLSSADYDEDYTNKQLDIFKTAINITKNILGKLKYIHTSASNGLLNYQNNYCNLVRPGIILYGYDSSSKTKEKINVKPISKLKSKITFLKTVEDGTSISYSRTYITKGKTKIATIPMGYADGLPRSLSNKGKVIINGQKVPIIGNICMDSFMADVTDIKEVNIGDDVYIWDNKIITLEEVASTANTINYEIICTISNRVPRLYLN
mgnify:CR=1 FL=1